MLMKTVAAVFAAIAVLAALRLLGATPSLQSPMLLAELCGLFAIAASVIALFGPEIRGEDEQLSVSPAAQPPRSPNM